MTLLFIINGEDVLVEAEPEETLGAARDQGLKQSRNTGRPPEDWTVRDETGKEIDPAALIESFGWPRKVRLFLSLKIGFGGGLNGIL